MAVREGRRRQGQPAGPGRQGQGGVQCLTAQLDTEISECSDLLLLVGLVHMDGQLRTQVDAHGHAAAGCCCCLWGQQSTSGDRSMMIWTVSN